MTVRILRGFAIVNLFLFAAIGFMLMAGFIAVRFGLTKSAGAIDLNDRYFQKVARKDIARQAGFGQEPSGADMGRILHRLAVLGDTYPKNAELILANLRQNGDLSQADRMMDAVDLRMADDAAYQARVARFEALRKEAKPENHPDNLFRWMNTEEWQSFRAGILKDKDVILKAAKDADADPRLIVTMVVSEQVRLFFAQREIFKKFFAPLKVLGNETKFSLGVAGIKDSTGRMIEASLKDRTSPFYLGEAYEGILDYRGMPLAPRPVKAIAAVDPNADPSQVAVGGEVGDEDWVRRYRRLTDRSHYPSYLYTAILTKQIIKQWERAGYDISNRPEIIATLFNIGAIRSKPNPNPQVGGSKLEINGVTYTFGSMAYEFFYSGELADVFPCVKAARGRTDHPRVASAQESLNGGTQRAAL
jgi:hypothetical protein